MSVGGLVGKTYREVGASSFFVSFFSTVSANLEPNGWGSRFPTVMRRFYEGRMSPADVPAAVSELSDVYRELGRLPPSAVVSDYEDRSKQPPWGDDIDPRITSLANYFVTSDGKDLFEVLFAALGEAGRLHLDVIVQ